MKPAKARAAKPDKAWAVAFLPDPDELEKRQLPAGLNLTLYLLLGLFVLLKGLAPVIVQKLAEMILTLKAKGYTIVLVEQNFRFAAPLADRHYVVEHGNVVEVVNQNELTEKASLLNEYLGV